MSKCLKSQNSSAKLWRTTRLRGKQLPHSTTNSHLLTSQDIQTLFLLTLARKAGGRCGFAESMPEERITALKVDGMAMEMTDVVDGANDIVRKAEAPRQKYPIFWSQTDVTKTGFLMYLSERENKREG